MRNDNLLHLSRKLDRFREKWAHLSKNLKFCQKTLLFAIKSKEFGNEFVKLSKKYGEWRDSNPPLLAV